MAAPAGPPATPEAKAAAIAEDLQFLLADCGCTIATQAKVWDAFQDQTNMSQFSLIGDAVADVRPAIRVLFQINEADGRDERIQAMALLAAWKKAIKRTSERDTAEAAAAQSGRPLVFPNSDHISRRAAFETKFHIIREEDIPSKSYIEMLETRLSEADLRAEPLKEVTTREIEDEAQEFFERDAASGFLKATRTRKKQKDEVPKGPEELRKVIKRMGIAWSMLAIKHANRAYLQGICPDLFLQHVDYILSEEVMGLMGYDEHGQVVSAPSWALVLAYEWQLRKKAWRIVQDPTNPINNFPAALKAAWADSTTKERYFLSPLSVSRGNVGPDAAEAGVQPSSRRRSRTPPRRHGSDSYGSGSWGGKGGKPKGKGKGRGSKGKGEGKGKGAGKFPDRNGVRFRNQTPDGENICYAWNSPSERCRNKACRYVHCCGYCFSTKHPAPMCKAKVENGKVVKAEPVPG